MSYLNRRIVGATLVAALGALCLSLPASAQEQSVWAASGARQRTPDATLDAEDFGVRSDDGRSDVDALEAVIAAASADGGAVIELPTGVITIDRTLRLASNVVVRGRGDGTVLALSVGDGPGIYGGGSAKSDRWRPLSTDAVAGSVTIDGLVDDGLIEIEQDNTPEMVTSRSWDVGWGKRSEGELVHVEGAADGRRLTDPLIASYSASRNARYRSVEAITNVGIEDLRIVREGDGSGHSVQFKYADNVWLSNVSSENTSRAHVAFDVTANCSVIDSEFTGATSFGDGGEGYGISVARHTTRCAFVGNRLSDLRHAIIVQLGASGNVFAYNDARGSHGYADARPRSDISLHGHWPQSNLFVENRADRIEVGDWWGPAGPGNTFVRNCVTEHLLVMDHSDDQVVVENRIGAATVELDPTVETLVRPREAPSSLLPSTLRRSPLPCDI